MIKGLTISNDNDLHMYIDTVDIKHLNSRLANLIL